ALRVGIRADENAAHFIFSRTSLHSNPHVVPGVGIDPETKLRTGFKRGSLTLNAPGVRGNRLHATTGSRKGDFLTEVNPEFLDQLIRSKLTKIAASVVGLLQRGSRDDHPRSPDGLYGDVPLAVQHRASITDNLESAHDGQEHLHTGALEPHKGRYVE